jgi:hypothetical protein
MGINFATQGSLNEIATLITFAYSRSGPLAANVIGIHRLYNDTGRVLEIVAVRGSVGTPPAGAVSIKLDANINGTTIFTNQANRPEIFAGENTDVSVLMDIDELQPGEYMTVDIDSVGEVTPGSDLVVEVTCRG